MDTVTLALLCLATARLSRIVTTDRILNWPRSRLVRRLGGAHPLSYFVVCDWCVSIYAGVGVAAAWHLWGDTRWFVAVSVALAASHVSGYLASRTED